MTPKHNFNPGFSVVTRTLLLFTRKPQELGVLGNMYLLGLPDNYSVIVQLLGNLYIVKIYIVFELMQKRTISNKMDNHRYTNLMN